MSRRLAALATALALLGPSSTCLAQAGSPPAKAAPTVTEADRQAFRKQAGDAGEGEMMALVRQAYPEDYLTYEGDVIAARKAGASRDELRKLAFKFGNDLRERIEPYVKRAPTSDLLGFLRNQAEVIEQLRTVSPRACYESIERGGLSPESAQTITPTMARRLSAAGELRMRVGLKGKASPVNRERPSAADYAAAKAAFLASGGDPAWLEAMTKGAPREQSDEVRCRSAQTYLNGLLSLPADQAARLVAF